MKEKINTFFNQQTRQEWISILAKGRLEALEEAWAGLPEKPEYYFLRPPEIGLLLVRARFGGQGNQFNLGEMTITRCTVQVQGGFQGTAYIVGRQKRHAELAAVFDALLQDLDHHPKLMDSLILPIKKSLVLEKRMLAQKIDQTRVEFFTLVRGE